MTRQERQTINRVAEARTDIECYRAAKNQAERGEYAARKALAAALDELEALTCKAK